MRKTCQARRQRLCSRAHCALTGDANTKDRKVKERNLFARLAFTFFLFSRHLCVCLSKENASEVAREEKKREEKM
jgi:hypothetical protein